MAKKAARKAASTEKRGPGRPPKVVPYKNPMSVWFTDQQLAFVERAVGAAGLSRNEYLRRAALAKAAEDLGEEPPTP